ncbi:hypothetical protein EIP91_011015 [Steccherinum ochraceum]|uniref:MYND-type domain-containing protein n=1 Tax=Steccherinum ochraceum TaxID=92696 RepID=A0A4R0R008_9APHY|nr:hypothetical protein EIP91_011015 [Steccherinum ochraceum]
MARLADPRQAYPFTGLDLPITLPPFALVQHQVAFLSKLRQSRQVLSSDDYMKLFPALFAFCMLVETVDVPDYMLDDLAFISRMFTRHISEDPSGVFADHDGESKDKMMELLRLKRVAWLTTITVNRPLEALEEMEIQVQEEKKFLRQTNSPYVDTPWIPAWRIYERYGGVLVLANKFDMNTYTILKNTLAACDHPFNADALDIVLSRAMIQMHLALMGEVLDIRGVEHDRNIQAAVRYLRKHRTTCRHVCEVFLKRDDQPPHPVCVALGEDWFTNRPSLRDDKHPGKFCMYCNMPEQKMTLFKCSRCKSVCYCSRECQKADWKGHKSSCQGYAEDQRRIDEARRNYGPRAAMQMGDLTRWCGSSHYANFEALIHALGLRQDPNRGRTHIVLREIEHVSESRPADFRARVRVTKCSVYKIADVAGEVARILGSSKTPEGYRAYLQESIDEVARYGDEGKPMPGAPSTGFRRLVVVYVTTGPGIKAHLNTNNIAENYVRSLPYEPDWRQKINGVGGAPGPFVLPNRARDAENVF